MAGRPLSDTSDVFATPLHTPLHADNAPLDPPSASYLNPGQSLSPTPRDSYGASASASPSPSNSTPFLVQQRDKEDGSAAEVVAEKSEYTPTDSRVPFYRKPWVWLAAAAAVVVIVLAIVLPVVLVANKKHSDSNTSGGSSSGTQEGGGSSSDPGNGNGSPQSAAVITGGDGSTITMENGQTFTYRNSFGGYWVDDPKDPFNNGARPNSWTPALNQSWTWGKDRVYGVNLGGLFVIEPFISPSLFQKYTGAHDEWTLSQAMAADTASGGLQTQMEQHYDTFITEQDLAEIAGAGLNWIRVPIPFWAIETWEGEPFLAKVSWKYILRLFGWARKYGLRIYLDLHTVPGSQNGYNHSGKQGQVNFMNGFMGLANAQRTLDYIRIITEFISQPDYRDLIPIFGIVNEALVSTIGQNQMTNFYYQAHQMIRSITGLGAGHGPYITIHDGFIGVSKWANFLPGSDRIILDTHPYFAFDGQPNTQPLVTDEGTGQPGGIWPKQACNSWGASINTSRSTFGVTVGGEFSNGYNDCGLFVNGVTDSHNYPGDCTVFTDWQNWNATFKEGLKNYATASMDAIGDWYFWTWKIGNSSTSNSVEAPLWSYQLGLENGWIPTDPRDAVGRCVALGANQAPFDGTFEPWQTGGAGAGTISASAAATASVWPPPTLSNIDGAAVAILPTYTPTGSLATLPPPTLTPVPTASVPGGWFDAQDTASAETPIAGCSYPNAWDSDGVVPPTAACPAPTARP